MIVSSSVRSSAIVALTTLLIACGGGGGGGGNDSVTDSVTSAVTVIAPSGDNVQPIFVNGGPLGIPNLAYTSVTVCVPGTTQCKTIDNILVDTGSMGLRLVPSALGSLALPQQSAAGGDPLFACVEFVDLSHAWGPVRTADVQIGGLRASSIQIQTIGDVGANTEPVECGNGDTTQNLATVEQMGANGILGVGLFREDCGAICGTVTNNRAYYSCPASGCAPTTADTAIQVKNPTAFFPSDNNGVIIQLPAIASSGAASVDGWMIFGIGTRENNALGSATIYQTDDVGYIITRYDGVDYNHSFVDSGSNGLFFPDSSIPTCANASGFYCPSGTLRLSGTLIGFNNASTTISFDVANAETLNGGFFAFDNLAGPYDGGFDWGMPFFFGRKVYTALETNPEGPYIAF